MEPDPAHLFFALWWYLHIIRRKKGGGGGGREFMKGSFDLVTVSEQNHILLFRITSALKLMMPSQSYQNKNNGCSGWSLSQETQDSTDYRNTWLWLRPPCADKLLNFFPPCLPYPAFGPHRDQCWEGPRQWPAHPDNSSNHKATIIWRVRSDCVKQTAFWAWPEDRAWYFGLHQAESNTTCLLTTDFGGTSHAV